MSDNEGLSWVDRLKQMSAEKAKGLPRSAKDRRDRIEAYLDVSGGLGDLWEFQGGKDDAYYRYTTELMNRARMGVLPTLEEKLDHYMPGNRFYPMLAWAHELINGIYWQEARAIGDDPSEMIKEKITKRFLDDPSPCLKELNDYAPVVMAMMEPLPPTFPATGGRLDILKERWRMMIEAWAHSEGINPDISRNMIDFVRRSGQRFLDMKETANESPYNVLNSMRFVLMRLDGLAAAIRPTYANTPEGAAEMNEALEAQVPVKFEKAFLNLSRPQDSMSSFLNAASTHNDLLLRELDGFVTNETHLRENGRA